MKKPVSILMVLICILYAKDSRSQDFQKVIRNSNRNIAQGITSVSADKIILTGNSYPPVFATNLSKWDTSGNLLWLKNYSAANFQIQASDCMLDYNGNYLIAGQATGSSGWCNFVLVTDTNGNLISKKFYRLSHDDFYEKTILTHDSGLVFLNSQSDGTVNISKIDMNRNFMWSRNYSYQTLATGWNYDMVETSDHGFFVTAYLSCPTSCDYPIKFKIDSTGNVIWCKMCSAGANEAAESNHTYYVLTDIGNTQLIMLYDTAGNINSVNSFSISNFQITNLTSFKPDPSGGIYFSGMGYDNTYQMFIAHADSFGSVDYFFTHYNSFSEEGEMDFIFDGNGSVYSTGWTSGIYTDTNDVFLFKHVKNASGCNSILRNVTNSSYALSDTLIQLNVGNDTLIAFDDSVVQSIDTLSIVIDYCDPTLRVDETANDELTLYPNPVENQFTINGPSKPFSLTIYNSLNQKIYSCIQSPGTPIEFDNYPAGFYIISIVDDTKTSIVKKVIKY